MKIGIIGAGSIGLAWAQQFVKAGFAVTLSNRRGPESLHSAVAALGKNARAGTVREAASSDVVLVSVPWKFIPEALAGLPPWSGRIVIDANNPIVPPGFSVAELGGRTSSEVFTELVPAARVVKAGNHLKPELIVADPSEGNGRRIQFVSGDDADAKQTVIGLFEKAGFAAIDLGGLAQGGRLHQFPGGPLPGLNLLKLA